MIAVCAVYNVGAAVFFFAANCGCGVDGLSPILAISFHYLVGGGGGGQT